jgi:hypothetical protein
MGETSQKASKLFKFHKSRQMEPNRFIPKRRQVKILFYDFYSADKCPIGHCIMHISRGSSGICIIT